MWLSRAARLTTALGEGAHEDGPQCIVAHGLLEHADQVQTVCGGVRLDPGSKGRVSERTQDGDSGLRGFGREHTQERAGVHLR